MSALHEADERGRALTQAGRAVHRFKAIKKSLKREITCGPRLTPSGHPASTARTASNVVMEVLLGGFVGLASGGEEIVNFLAAYDPLGVRHAEPAGNPAC